MSNKYPNKNKNPEPEIPVQIPQYNIVQYGSQLAILDVVNNHYVLEGNEPKKFHSSKQAEAYITSFLTF